MKDVELQARLRRLGMNAPTASRVTAHIRDKLHPAAVVAVARLNGYGDDEPGMGNIFKNIKRNLKTVVNKIVLPVAATVLAPATGGMSVVAYGAAKGASGIVQAKKQSAKQMKLAAAQSGMTTAQYKAAVKAQDAQNKALLKQQKTDKKSAKQAAKLLKKGVTATGVPATPTPQDVIGVNDPAATMPLSKKDQRKADRAAKKAAKNLSKQMAAGGAVAVPGSVSDASSALAAQMAAAGQTGGDVSDAMAAGMASSGMNFSSPAAQGLLDDVAAQGVEATPAGPSSLPSWALPVGIAAGVVGLMMVMGKKR